MRLSQCLLVAAVSVCCAPADARVARYNTSSARQVGRINLHLVPHTHDDVGWLKTVDQYFLGSHNAIQHAGVVHIINAVIKELAWNADRKFSYVEQAFFQRWWAQADDQMRATTRDLVANGQLTFVNGAWSMHDEANPSFVDMIDNTALGHRVLMEEFGDAARPTTTWQIDPFGHSTFQASVMSSPAAGFNALFFMRADWQDIAARQAARTTEMVWAPSPTLGLAGGATYAGILYGGYCTVPGLSMDSWSDDEPVMDDQSLEEYNVPFVVNQTVETVLAALKVVPQGGDGATADIMLPLGCDFEWENAGTWFTNTDKLIHYLNLNGTVNAFYSTPAMYAAAKLEAGKRYTLKTDDFMPYDFWAHAYLTGFFTSRPALKGYIRDSSALFQAAKQVQALTGGAADTGASNALYRLERAMGVTQHHDAVTGSSKQAVAYDYARQLAEGRADADAMLSAAFAALTRFNASGGGAFGGLVWASCDLANATICAPLEAGQPTVLLVYNQHAQAAAAGGSGVANVRVPVGLSAAGGTVDVFDEAAQPVSAQLLPLSAADSDLRQRYYNATPPSGSGGLRWLAFQAARVPAAGFVTYFLVPAPAASAGSRTHHSAVQRVALAAADATTLSNGIQTLTFDGATGLLAHAASAATGLSMPLAQTLLWYNSSDGGGPQLTASQPSISGAYIFRPNASTPFPVAANGSVLSLELVTGPVVSEARQAFAPWATQVVRLWAGAASAWEAQYTLGPLPFADGLGREVISRFDASPALATNATWFTDSNGRDSVRRVRNHRPSWNLTVEEPVAGNYNPVPTFIYAADAASGATLSVVTDRAQGGASIADGQLELMLHRRLQHDDRLGVGEPLNETGLDATGDGLIVRVTHVVSLDASPAAAARSRRVALQDALFRPLHRVAALPVGVSPAQWVAAYSPTFSGLAAPLPPQLHLLTAHAWGPAQLLLRLSHSYEAGEDPELSAPASVDLAALFAPASLTLSACAETTLTGNQPLDGAPSWTYAVEGGAAATLPAVPPPPAGPNMTVTLSALQIRTFLCTAAFAAAAV